MLAVRTFVPGKKNPHIQHPREWRCTTWLTPASNIQYPASNIQYPTPNPPMNKPDEYYASLVNEIITGHHSPI
jgi:hypothetical protein